MIWIVCGFYTPDYAQRADVLRLNLDRIGAPHDLHPTPKLPGGWEVNTRAKPTQIRAAMQRHPGKTIAFLDVDCTIPGGRDRLANLAHIVGDVGLYVRTRTRSNGRPLFAPRSGTVIVRPTAAAGRFVDAWIDVSNRSHCFSVDQNSLVVALGRVSGLSLTIFGVEACAIAADRCANPIILHDSEERPRARKWRQLASAFAHRFQPAT